MTSFPQLTRQTAAPRLSQAPNPLEKCSLEWALHVANGLPPTTADLSFERVGLNWTRAKLERKYGDNP